MCPRIPSDKAWNIRSSLAMLEGGFPAEWGGTFHSRIQHLCSCNYNNIIYGTIKFNSNANYFLGSSFLISGNWDWISIPMIRMLYEIECFGFAGVCLCVHLLPMSVCPRCDQKKILCTFSAFIMITKRRHIIPQYTSNYQCEVIKFTITVYARERKYIGKLTRPWPACSPV